MCFSLFLALTREIGREAYPKVYPLGNPLGLVSFLITVEDIEAQALVD